MPDDKNVDMPVFFPDGVNNRKALEETIQEFRLKIEEIREVENNYLDGLISDLELMVSSEMAEHINLSQDNDEVCGDEAIPISDDLQPSTDNSDIPLSFPDFVPKEKSLLEKWKDEFVASVLRVECLHQMLDAKKDYVNSFLAAHPFEREIAVPVLGEAPEKTEDAGLYATVKQILFG